MTPVESQPSALPQQPIVAKVQQSLSGVSYGKSGSKWEELMGISIFFVTVCVVVIAFGTINKKNWGFNFSPPKSCIRCGSKLNKFGLRTPTNVNQALWGGFTCRSCGTNFDKWGRDLR